VRYDDFVAEYDRVHNAWSYGNLPADQVPHELERLRALIPQIDEPEFREWGDNLLNRWQSRIDGPARGRRARASAVLARAHRATGTSDERLAQYRQGIAEIASIADEAADDGERAGILGSAEMLGTLIDGIEYDREHPGHT